LGFDRKKKIVIRTEMSLKRGGNLKKLLKLAKRRKELQAKGLYGKKQRDPRC